MGSTHELLSKLFFLSSAEVGGIPGVAVEKSLDSYKFNLLHCKQTFISQLKSGALGARTIDEKGGLPIGEI